MLSYMTYIKDRPDKTKLAELKEDPKLMYVQVHSTYGLKNWFVLKTINFIVQETNGKTTYNNTFQSFLRFSHGWMKNISFTTLLIL